MIVATHFQALGAKVVLVAPEQSADLRRYFTKHTKNDRLDSLMLARMPLLHPEGLSPVSDLGSPTRCETTRFADESSSSSRIWPAGSASTRCWICLDPATPKFSGFEAPKRRCTSSSTTETLSLRRLGLRRLTDLVKRTSGGHWNAGHAERLLAAAHEAVTIWAGGGIDFDELA